ncbi:YlxM family DNA-binding protein [Natranaerobius thermophilus]|uniref:UPF0122 protein Nther_1367 n=1 Tax=Natranaerobius thermophilus (strain ATCC BAA-1301 / DSM 18059 / JW/NM-WN-LF) TaxID=457570 RepID=B2A2N5_NATTJ|nr:YlxM family DNA-binding protein [Natranaerobius thermophilus]ACB84950.1 putative helix-turn-helix protein YlxM/p13 family protein [Natranaerobius thermophilus JW/NM-WN-LF]
MLEKTNKLIMLFDFYGELLTPRQKEIFKLYYYEDFSLGEISELEGISRQAVYDLLQRCEELLQDYESRLGFVDRFTFQRKSLKKIKEILTRETHLDNNTREKCLKLLDELLRSEA